MTCASCCKAFWFKILYLIIIGALFALISIVSWGIYQTVSKYVPSALKDTGIPTTFDKNTKYMMITEYLGAPYTPEVYRSTLNFPVIN